MASFYGSGTHAIDHKGRVSIPASLRRGEGKRPLDTFYVVQGLEGCVALYPTAEFKHVEDRLRRLPIWDRRGRLLARMYLRDAQKLTCDGQGRITLSPALIKWAGLEKVALVYGQVDHIEIWNPRRLDAHLTASPDTLEQLMAEVFKEERS